jgi:hypothetical protein
MQASLTVVSGMAFMLLGFVLLGGPMALVDWFRRRRQTAIARQIALTDALDGRLGALVAPEVRKPLFGPWEIRIAVPFHRSAMVARILSVVAEMFQDVDGAGSRPYRIFLSATLDSLREKRAPRTPRSAERWARRPIAAA